jgi:hypothetical protein
MSASQKRAVENHRRRMNERGMARYEVRGLAKDKALVREFAKRLTTNDAEAERLRESVAQKVANEWPRTGKDIWNALRRSPLVGLDLDLDIEREFTTGRDVDL